MSTGRGQEVFFLVKTNIFICVHNVGRFELVELIREQINLSCTISFIAAQLSQRGISGSHVVKQRRHTGAVDTSETIKRGSLYRAFQQRLMRVLSVKINEIDAVVSQGTHRCETTIDIDAGAAVARNNASHDKFLVAINESALNLCFGGAGPHQRCVCSAPGQQIDRTDDKSLTRAVSPVTAVIPGPKSSVTSSITPRFRTTNSVNTTALRLVRLLDLGRLGYGYSYQQWISKCCSNGH